MFFKSYGITYKTLHVLISLEIIVHSTVIFRSMRHVYITICSEITYEVNTMEILLMFHTVAVRALKLLEYSSFQNIFDLNIKYTIL